MKPTGTVRLVDKRTRVVEVYGPPPPSGRRPRLFVEEYGATPIVVGAFCFQMKDREAKFMIPKGTADDQLLNMLDRPPMAKARPGSSYGPDGLWHFSVFDAADT